VLILSSGPPILISTQRIINGLICLGIGSSIKEISGYIRGNARNDLYNFLDTTNFEKQGLASSVVKTLQKSIPQLKVLVRLTPYSTPYGAGSQGLMDQDRPVMSLVVPPSKDILNQINNLTIRWDDDLADQLRKQIPPIQFDLERLSSRNAVADKPQILALLLHMHLIQLGNDQEKIYEITRALLPLLQATVDQQQLDTAAISYLAHGGDPKALSWEEAGKGAVSRLKQIQSIDGLDMKELSKRAQMVLSISPLYIMHVDLVTLHPVLSIQNNEDLAKRLSDIMIIQGVRTRSLLF